MDPVGVSGSGQLGFLQPPQETGHLGHRHPQLENGQLSLRLQQTLESGHIGQRPLEQLSFRPQHQEAGQFGPRQQPPERISASTVVEVAASVLQVSQHQV